MGRRRGAKRNVHEILSLTEPLHHKVNDTADQKLGKAEVLDHLREFETYYSHIVTALARMQTIAEKSGRPGGIQLRMGKGIPLEMVAVNRRDLPRHLSRPGSGFTTRQRKDDRLLERQLYEPLREYLEELGQYQLVENRAQLRHGKKFENADLVAVTFSSLSYHAGIFPKLTGIEVKRSFPTVKDVQQAAAYLRYCQSAYLCFFDCEYTGKNLDDMMTRLRDEGIWDALGTSDIGLIVGFCAQKHSPRYHFHVLKEAPEQTLDPNVVEQGIDPLLGEDSKAELRNALQQQMVKLIARVHDLH